MNVTAQHLHGIGVSAIWVEPINTTLVAFGINNADEIAAFIAQTAHESGRYTRLEEGLNYSAESLVRVWPSHFNASNAAQYAHQPERIANRAYASRDGNRDEASGDGYRFRGRGAIQLTGHDNYWHCGQTIKIDLVATPDLVSTPMYAMLSAGWFWKTHKCNLLADNEDWVALTKRINGGTIGLEDRVGLTQKMLSILNN